MRGHTWAYFRQRDREWEIAQRHAKLAALALLAGLLFAALLGGEVGR